MLKIIFQIFFSVILLATIAKCDYDDMEPTERPFVNILRKSYTRQQLFNLIRQLNKFEQLYALIDGR